MTISSEYYNFTGMNPNRIEAMEKIGYKLTCGDNFKNDDYKIYTPLHTDFKTWRVMTHSRERVKTFRSFETMLKWLSKKGK